MHLIMSLVPELLRKTTSKKNAIFLIRMSYWFNLALKILTSILLFNQPFILFLSKIFVEWNQTSSKNMKNKSLCYGRFSADCQGWEHWGASLSLLGPLEHPPSHPVVRDPISALFQSLSQWFHNKASLHLPTTLPCSTMGPAEPVPSAGPHPVQAYPVPVPRSCPMCGAGAYHDVSQLPGCVLHTTERCPPRRPSSADPGLHHALQYPDTSK